MSEYIEKRLGINDFCFGCGEKNPIGAKLSFYKISKNSVGSQFHIPKTWGGWGKVVHGGLQTVLMDEVSGWTVITQLEETCLTINVNLQFFRPLYIEEDVEIVGEIEEIKDRDIIVKSYIKNSNGQICTEGKFTFRKVTKEKIEQIAGVKFNN